MTTFRLDAAKEGSRALIVAGAILIVLFGANVCDLVVNNCRK